MVTRTQPPESDLWLPLPAKGEEWNDHTIHTHYTGFSVPEEKIGVFIYCRYMPAFPLSSGGVCIFQGLDNEKPLDIEHCNFVITMPWPKTDGNTIEFTNGLQQDFLEPGKKVRLRYRSKPDKYGNCDVSFDILQEAVSPLLPRGHVMPGEDRDADPALKPGGSEQFMHCTGILNLHSKKYRIDCYPCRDRSWRQIRTEEEVVYPPVGWSPMYFGEDLSFHQVGYEAPDTNPVWEGIFEVDKSKPSHYFAQIITHGEVHDVVRVKRNVLEYHPKLFSATKQEIEAEDDQGKVYHFKGEAIAMAELPSWPNNCFIDSVYRWTDDRGRTTHCVYQEAWYARFQRYKRGKSSA